MLYHATGTYALTKILETGEMRPANIDPFEGTKAILSDYIDPKLITDDLISSVLTKLSGSFTFIQQFGDRKGSIFFCSEIDKLLGESEYSSKKYSEDGGEFGVHVRKALEALTGIKIEPRFKGAQSTILEIDISQEETKPGLGGELAYKGKISNEFINQIYLLNEQGEITKSISKEQAKEYLKNINESKPPLLTHLGDLDTSNNAFYNACIKAAPLRLREENLLYTSQHFISKASQYANGADSPRADKFRVINDLRYYRSEPTLSQTINNEINTELYNISISQKGITINLNLETDSNANSLEPFIGNKNKNIYKDDDFVSGKYRQYIVPYEDITENLSNKISGLISEYREEIKTLIEKPYEERLKVDIEGNIITPALSNIEPNQEIDIQQPNIFSPELNWEKMDSPQYGIVLRMDASNFDNIQRIEMIEALQSESLSPVIAYSRTFNKEYFQLSGDDVKKFDTLKKQINIQPDQEQVTLLENINDYWKKFESSQYGVVLRFDASNFDDNNPYTPSEFTQELVEGGFNAKLIKNEASNNEYIQISGGDAQKFENMLKERYKQVPLNKPAITPSM